jgi:lipoate-protein ligase A
MSSWSVEHLTGTAQRLHGREALHDVRRRVVVLDVDRRAMVLGSTQRTEIVDHDAARALEVDIVRRQTGGGAVYLDPAQHVWIDVVIPAGDPLWHDDVARAFEWLGTTWTSALAEVGVTGTRVSDAAVCHSVLGRLMCFAGLGFGEIATDRGKVVGLAQRRTRNGAWFQCTVLGNWDTSPYERVLAPGLAEAADDPRAALAAVRVHPVAVEDAAVVAAFVRHLPA